MQMSPSKTVIGADGGATKTLVVLADEEGRELSRSSTGASNPNVVGMETAGDRLVSAIKECCVLAQCDLASIRSAVLGLAGAGNTENRHGIMARLCSALGPGFPACIETDARIALEGAHVGREGIVIIAGTGSVVIAKTAEAEVLTIGGWGRSLGDDGSGFFLGTEAAKAATRARDGVEKPGYLVHILERHLGWTGREQVIQSVYREKIELSSLAPVVLEAAGQGDVVSLEILRRGASALAGQASVAANRLGTSSIDLATCGGLIDHPTMYRDILVEELRRRDARIRVIFAERQPVEGAVLMALAGMR